MQENFCTGLIHFLQNTCLRRFLYSFLFFSFLTRMPTNLCWFHCLFFKLDLYFLFYYRPRVNGGFWGILSSKIQSRILQKVFIFFRLFSTNSNRDRISLCSYSVHSTLKFGCRQLAVFLKVHTQGKINIYLVFSACFIVFLIMEVH